MKYYHRLIEELRENSKTHKVGTVLKPPNLLRFVEVDGKKMYYLHLGLEKPGPAIVCLHGFGGFFYDWARVMIPLSKRHPIYVPDLVGWGFSEFRDDCKIINDEVTNLLKFLGALKLQEVILVGISYGGAVAWACAALKIKKIKRLILLNPMPPFPLRFLGSFHFNLIFTVFRSRILGTLLHKMFFTKKAFVHTSLEYIQNKSKLDMFYVELGYFMLSQPHIPHLLHVFAKAAKRSPWKDWEEKLKEIDIPVTILKGNEDHVFDDASASYLQSLIPHSEMIRIKNCGHGMLHDKYRQVLVYILRVMGEHK